MVYNVRDLALWITDLPSVKHAILPPSTQRPNPRLADGLVFASIFSPGAVHALDPSTGEIVWSREINPFGHASVEFANGLLLVQSPHTLFALESSSGEIRWEFCPHGSKGESIYSSAVFHRNKLFIGDRAGDLHCLDLASGAPIWRKRAAATGQVNSTALAWGDFIFVATTERTIVALEEATGTIVWRSALDGPCIQELQRFQNNVAVVTDSLTLFDMASGEQVSSSTWPGEGIWSMVVAGRNVLLSLYTNGEGTVQYRLVWLGNGVSPEESWSGEGFLRYDSLSDLIYVSSLRELSVVAPKTRSVKYRIEEEAKMFGALPDAADGLLYLLDQSGRVSALRLPE